MSVTVKIEIREMLLIVTRTVSDDASVTYTYDATSGALPFHAEIKYVNEGGPYDAEICATCDDHFPGDSVETARQLLACAEDAAERWSQDEMNPDS